MKHVDGRSRDGTRQKIPERSRKVPVWLSILPMMAAAIAATGTIRITHWYRHFNARVWKPAIVVMLLFRIFLHSILIGLPGLSALLGSEMPVAWKGRGREADYIAKKSRKSNRYRNTRRGNGPLSDQCTAFSRSP